MASFLRRAVLHSKGILPSKGIVSSKGSRLEATHSLSLGIEAKDLGRFEVAGPVLEEAAGSKSSSLKSYSSSNKASFELVAKRLSFKGRLEMKP